MSDLAICRRYAAALHAEAESAGLIETVDDDVATLRDAIKESRELAMLFASPVINAAKKRDIIQKLFAEHVSDLFLRFLLLLNEKGRGDLVGNVLVEYRKLRNRQLGIVEAEARSAMELSDGEVDALKKKLADQSGMDVHLHVETDASLLGGVVVRVGDTVYDGSLKRRLSVMRTQLEGGAIHKN